MSEELNELLIGEEDKKETKPVNNKKKETAKKAIPTIFFKKDSKIEISVDGYHSNETGQLQFVLLSENNNNEETLNQLFTKVNYKFWFSRVPYDKLNRYRSSSMIYNSEDQNNTINQLKLREFFLIFHLIDWSLTDENGKKVELKFDTNKALSDESLQMIYSLPSVLVDTVLATYERKMAIS